MAVMLFAVGEVGWPGLQVDFIGGPGRLRMTRALSGWAC